MKTTDGKPTTDRILSGDPELAACLADALGAVEFEPRGTHGFHTYPAGLHPDAARDLLALFGAKSVADPFCGGGTILVEGRIAGMQTFGLDLSPTAVRVARVRTATPDDDVLTAVRSTARRLTAEARKAEDPPPQPILDVVRQWYAPYVLAELESLRGGIEAADPVARPFLDAVLSSILIKVSWRRSDTSAKRVKHRRPRGTAAILFHKKARELARMLIDLRERVPAGTPDTVLREGDARDPQVPPVELVLTSPPYPATYDYLPLQHLRAAWFGDSWEGHGDEVGARRAWREGAKAGRRRWLQDTNAWTAAATDALVPGGHLVVVIGDGRTPAGDVDSAGPTAEAARRAGLDQVARASLERPDHARDDVRWEHVFAFRKPGGGG